MKDRYLLAQGQRRVLGIQDKSSVYRGEIPSERGATAVTPPAAEVPPPAQQFVGTLTATELDELKPWLLAVTLGSTGNTDLAGGYLAADVVKIHDSDDSHELSLVWNEAETSQNRTLNLIVNAGNRTIDLAENLKILDGQDIELHASGGEKAQLAIDTQNAERTLDMSENLTISDGYNVTLQALGQANSLILNESLTVGDGNSGTITFGNASDVLTINETMTLAGASGKTLTLNENLTVSDGTDITLTGVTQANTLTLYESLTLGDGNDGTITFKQASKALNVEGTNLIPYTGWPVTPGVTISFGGTRTVTVTDGGSAYYYCEGVKYILGGNKTVQIDDTEGLWYIYFDGATLTASQTIWSFAAEDKALVAYVYWDAANSKEIFLGYELHNFYMDGSTHGRLHYATGARWESGLLVSDALSEDVNLSAGDIWDEDLNIAISDGAGAGLFEQVLSPAELPIYYRSGASDWRIYETTDKANATDLGYVTGGALYYNKLNGTWASVAVSGANHIAMYVVATNEQTEPVALIMGQREDTTLANAKENNVFSGLTLTGLPFEEMVVLARLIVKESAAGLYYTLKDVTDLRAAFGDGNITSPLITDHGGLGGLGDDDHQQYILHSLFDADTFLYASSDNTPVATSPANVMAALSGHAAAGFSFNDQYVTNVQQLRGSPGHDLNIYPNAATTDATERDMIFWTLDATGDAWVEVFRCEANSTTPVLKMAKPLNMNSQNITGVGTIASGANTLTIDETASLSAKANLASPTFSGTVTVPSTNFTIGSTTFSETQLTEATTFFGSTDISAAEAETLTDGSDADALHAHDTYALESVLGTSIGTGLLLDTAVLQASAVLQVYHGINPSADVQSLLGAANYAAMMALLSGEAGAAFSFNEQEINEISEIDARKSAAHCRIIAETYSDDTADYSELRLIKSHTDTLNTDVATVDTEVLGRILFGGVDTAPGLYYSAYITVTQDGNATGAKVPAKMEFWTASTVNRLARLSISPVGDVDIIAHDAATVGLKLGGTLVEVSAAESNYSEGVTSAIQTQLDARCLESVFGTAISTGLLLDGTDLKASTVLQTYHGIDPSADVQSLLGCADEAAIRTLLDLEAGTDFYSVSTLDTALGLKAALAGPTFSGTVTVPSTNFTIGSTTFSETQLTEATTFFGSTDISAAEAETLTDGSDADALHAHDTYALESVLGTSIGTGLLLDTAVLQASAVLQVYHGINPSADVQSLLGCADEAAIRTLLDLEAGTDFYSISAADEAFQGLDATLTAFASLLTAANKIPYAIGEDTGAELDLATTVGNPGSDTTLVSEQGIREAITFSTTLAGLTDTTISGPADLDLLQYDNASSKWVDRTLAEAGVAANTFTAINALIGAADAAIDLNAQDLTGVGMITSTVTARDNDLIMTTYSDNTGHYSTMEMRKSHSDTLGTKTTTIDGETLGGFVFRSVDSSGNFDYGAYIGAFQDGDAGIYVPTKLVITNYSNTTAHGGLEFGADGSIDFKDHDGATIGLKLGGTLVTKTAAEINAMAPLAWPSFTGTPLAPDHGAAATDMLVNVCYGTGAAPAANTTTIGSLYIKYVA